MMWFNDPHVALLWSIRLASLGVLLDGLQQLHSWQTYRDEGLLGWNWLRTRRGLLKRRGMQRIFRLRGVLMLHTLRCLAATLLLIGPMHPLTTALGLPLVAITGALLHLRQFPYGIVGANRMLLLIFVALTLWRVQWQSELVTVAVLWFLALQVCLSYATAGWSKAIQPAWRHGTAVGETLAVEYIGAPQQLRTIVAEMPRLNRLLTWGTMGMEVCFPLIFVLPGSAKLLMLAWGIGFHSSNALLIGLNTFVPAWLACYPALLWCLSTIG